MRKKQPQEGQPKMDALTYQQMRSVPFDELVRYFKQLGMSASEAVDRALKIQEGKGSSAGKWKRGAFAAGMGLLGGTAVVQRDPIAFHASRGLAGFGNYVTVPVTGGLARARNAASEYGSAVPAHTLPAFVSKAVMPTSAAWINSNGKERRRRAKNARATRSYGSAFMTNAPANGSSSSAGRLYMYAPKNQYQDLLVRPLAVNKGFMNANGRILGNANAIRAAQLAKIPLYKRLGKDARNVHRAYGYAKSMQNMEGGVGASLFPNTRHGALPNKATTTFDPLQGRAMNTWNSVLTRRTPALYIKYADAHHLNIRKKSTDAAHKNEILMQLTSGGNAVVLAALDDVKLGGRSLRSRLNAAVKVHVDYAKKIANPGMFTMRSVDQHKTKANAELEKISLEINEKFKGATIVWQNQHRETVNALKKMITYLRF